MAATTHRTRWESAKPEEIPPAEVIAELDRIAASEAFTNVERPVRFLRHLVETALRGDPQRLKESSVGVDVFDRPASWDPRIDPVVRQEAARLRKRLARYYATQSTASGVRIALPVGTYVPVRHSSTAAPGIVKRWTKSTSRSGWRRLPARFWRTEALSSISPVAANGPLRFSNNWPRKIRRRSPPRAIWRSSIWPSATIRTIWRN